MAHRPVKLALIGDAFAQQYCELLKMPELFGDLITGCGLRLSCAAPPACIIGVPYSYTLKASGGTPPYTYSIAAGTLPTGLSLDANTGEVSGTTTLTETQNVTFQVQDQDATTDQCSVVFYSSALLTITTTTLPDLTQDVAYSEQLAATGGVLPLTWSLAGGSLAPGLTLSSTGLISGTPTTTGAYSWTVRATDSGVQQTTQAYSVTVQEGAPVFDTGNPIPDQNAVLGEPFTYDASQHFIGGTATSYSLANEPPWMSIDNAGQISGTPDIDAVTAGITVTATNASGSDTSNAWSMTAETRPVVSSSAVDAAGTTLTITMSADTTGTTGFTLRANGTPVALSAPVDGAGTITFTCNQVYSGQTLTLDYAPGDVVDAGNGLALLGFTDAAVTNNSTVPIPTAPVYQSSNVDTTGTKLTVVYDSNVSGGTGFTYRVNGGTATPLTGAVVSGNEISFTVAQIFDTDTVTLSYTPGDVVGDPNGLPAEAFANQAVTNNSTVPSLQAPIFSGTIANQTGNVGTPFSLDVSGNFSTGGAVATYSLTNNPAWMSIDNAGVISGTPDAEAITAGITVTGTNAVGSDTSNAWQFDAQTGGFVPLFSRDYSTGSLGSDATFARASNGTFIDAAGLIQTAPNNVARFTYFHGGALQAEPALLMEPAATNYLLNSDTPATQSTGSLSTGIYVLWVNGAGSAEVAAGTATITGGGTATDGTPSVFTVTAAGTVNVTVTGSLDRFQLEVDGTPTSYIPTLSAEVSRAADSLSYSGVPAGNDEQTRAFSNGGQNIDLENWNGVVDSPIVTGPTTIESIETYEQGQLEPIAGPTDNDFVARINFTNTGTYQLSAYLGTATNVITTWASSIFYRRRGNVAWTALEPDGTCIINSVGEWEFSHEWNKSGNNVLTISFQNINAIDSCTYIYINESTLGAIVGDHFLRTAWSGCSNLTMMPVGFNLPESITSVGSNFLRLTWFDCSNLITMPSGFNLPAGITSVDSEFLREAWYNCSSLTRMPVGFNLPAGLTIFGINFLRSAWFNCSSLTTMPSGFNLPTGITSVTGSFLYATWADCSSLTTMPSGFNLPTGITSVAPNFLQETWLNCSSLTSIPSGFDLPAGITSVGANFLRATWFNCASLENNATTEDLNFPTDLYEATGVFGGTCPITPDSVTGPFPQTVAVNRS